MPFDPAKDAANIEKHGVSLTRAAELVIEVVIPDRRLEYGEARFRAFGVLDGEPHCLAFTMRGEELRPISLRRAHLKECRRHVS